MTGCCCCCKNETYSGQDQPRSAHACAAGTYRADHHEDRRSERHRHGYRRHCSRHSYAGPNRFVLDHCYCDPGGKVYAHISARIFINLGSENTFWSSGSSEILLTRCGGSANGFAVTFCRCFCLACCSSISLRAASLSASRTRDLSSRRFLSLSIRRWFLRYLRSEIFSSTTRCTRYDSSSKSMAKPVPRSFRASSHCPSILLAQPLVLYAFPLSGFNRMAASQSRTAATGIFRRMWHSARFANISADGTAFRHSPKCSAAAAKFPCAIASDAFILLVPSLDTMSRSGKVSRSVAIGPGSGSGGTHSSSKSGPLSYSDWSCCGSTNSLAAVY
mmetsp:Transcript_48256/g.92252  ORF Transcript_48256/g.92252 Transcript_48256/m.92252 type:complete len:332 (+) Transcript_48256:449-1444(+)